MIHPTHPAPHDASALPGLLVDWQVRDLCLEHGMVTPFQDRLHDHRSGVVSHGLSSAGLDVRLGFAFARYVSGTFNSAPVDPKRVTEEDVERFEAHESFVLEPGGCLLACTVERFRMPPNVTAFVFDKSTYARCFVDMKNTVFEPGWEGTPTLEITNNIPDRGVRIYPGEGIAQVMFFRHAMPDVPYGHRQGKYQDQPAVPILPRVAQAIIRP